MPPKKSRIVGANPEQVRAEKGLNPEEIRRFRNIARNPDSKGNWLPLSRARELAIGLEAMAQDPDHPATRRRMESIMNNKQYELIGESIWNTYSDMAYIMAEGIVQMTLPSGRTTKVTSRQAAARAAWSRKKGQRTEPQKEVKGSEATLGTTTDILARRANIDRIAKNR